MVNVIKDPNTGRKIAEIRDETNLTVMRYTHGAGSELLTAKLQGTLEDEK